MVGKILIVDDVATNRIALRAVLADAFYQPIMAVDGESCLRLARSDAPDLILLDLMLDDVPGIEVIQRLRADPASRDVPILALISAADASARLLALQAGADDILVKSVDQRVLLARIRNLFRGRGAVESLKSQCAGFEMFGLADAADAYENLATVALVTDRPDVGRIWHNDLAPLMRDQIVLQSREATLAEANSQHDGSVPDVFLIDCRVAGGGLSLMSELRSRPATRHAAICLVGLLNGAQSAVTAFDQGADDLVEFDIPADELALRLKTLTRRKWREDRLRADIQDGLRMATIDPLTGMHNRRYAMQHLAAIAERASQTGSTSAVMVIDIDRFKLVNDRLGHSAGDAVLVEAARRLQNSLRSGDLLARIGGDEFLVALPDTSFAEASLAAERLCGAIADSPIQVGVNSNLRITVTVSIGLTLCAADSCNTAAASVAAIIDRADHALLSAKSHGRNQVTVSRIAAFTP